MEEDEPAYRGPDQRNEAYEEGMRWERQFEIQDQPPGARRCREIEDVRLPR